MRLPDALHWIRILSALALALSVAAQSSDAASEHTGLQI